MLLTSPRLWGKLISMHTTTLFDSATFPLAISRCSLATGERTDLAASRRPTLILVEQGDVSVSFPQMDVPLLTHSALFINASRRCTLRSNRDSSFVVIDFSPMLFSAVYIEERYIRPLLASRIDFVVLTHRAVDALSRALEAFEEARFGHELAFLSGLFDVLADIVYEKQDILEAGDGAMDPRLARMLEFMDSHMDEHLTLECIARAGFVSQREASRIFSRALDTSPMRHLMSMRLETARRLLEDGTKSIGEVCAMTGFESLSHFSSAFRRMYATSPSEYRSRFV